MSPSIPPSHPPDCEYLVVGSGAGGGTLAARLAEAGRRVILLEAGGDPRELTGGDPVQPDANRLPHDYDVPAFHGFASENSAIAWNFFVRHYADDAVQRRDPKFVETHGGSRVDGVYYPRAGTLGGCTAHNAMIFVYPHNADWDYIAELTGDASWSSAKDADATSSASRTAGTVRSTAGCRSSASTSRGTAGTAGCRRKR